MSSSSRTRSQYQLLRQRRFRPLFVTQMLGAFNDNIYKNALVLLIAFQLAAAQDDADMLVNFAVGLFILPFFLFSASAGQIADKYEKSRLIRIVKLAEIGVMVLGALALYFQSIYMLLAVLFLMGTQSTFFGPLKYGILPQHLDTDELIGGNGLLEMSTFVAILLGTVLGGVLIELDEIGRHIVSLTVVAIAVLGWLTSRGIPEAKAVDPGLRVNWNFVTETVRIIGFTRRYRTVFLSILGISWFWFYGALFLAQLPNYTQFVLGGDGTVATLLLAVFSLGIGIGSLLCERLAGHRLELGLVPLGSIGMTVFGLDLAFAAQAPVGDALMGFGAFISNIGNWRLLVDLLLLSLFGGFFIVPLYALIQQRSKPSHLSRVIAGNNILNALFIVLAAVLAIVLLKAGLDIPQLFLVVAVMNAAVAVFIYTLVPEFLMRLIVWLLVHSIYRIHKEVLDNIPEEGPAVLVCNHVSYVDAMIIGAAVHRPIRFVMDHGIFSMPVLSFVFKTARAIPVAGGRKNIDLLRKAYDDIAEALENGELVCIFPEGKITYDGQINPFKRGIDKIIQRTPVPVIPLALCGMWGTFFSRKGGRAMSGLPTRLWSKVAVLSGPALEPAEVSAEALREVVGELRGDWC